MTCTAQELAETIRQELTKVKQDVSNWGLSQTGIDRILTVCASFESDVETVLAYLNAVGQLTTGRYERESLALILENVRDLKKAVEHQFAAARDAAWAAEWLLDRVSTDVVNRCGGKAPAAKSGRILPS